jgi:hypothetical protein
VFELFEFVVVVKCFELWHCWNLVFVDGVAWNCGEGEVLVVLLAKGFLMVQVEVFVKVLLGLAGVVGSLFAIYVGHRESGGLAKLAHLSD